MKDFVIICPSSGFVEDQYSIPNFTPLMLQAVYRRLHGLDVGVHYMHEHDNLLENIPEAKVYGLTVVTPNFIEAVRIYNYLSKERKSKVVAGGPHVSAEQEKCLKKICDIACVGAGENFPIKRFVDGNLENGVMYCSDIDLSIYEDVTLDYSDMNIMKYNSWLLHSDLGCRGACKFCYKMSKGLKKYPFNFIKRCINDAMNTSLEGKKKWIKLTSDNVLWKTDFELFDLLGELYNHVNYEVCARFDDITQWNIDYFDRMNCSMFKFGMESGSDKVLKLMNKRIDVKTMLWAAEEFKNSHMKLGVYLMVGFPGETDEDRKLTIETVKKINPDWWSVYRFTPYPGTPVWNGMLEEEKNKHRKNNFSGFYHAGRSEDKDPLVIEMERKIIGK